jgi:tartrate dehydrogenase/decarboxylase/D-malate dehydrogenase
MVGVDVIAEGLRVLRRAGEVTGSYAIETTVYPWSCQWYLEHGAMMPEDGLDRLRDSDSIYLGAVGFPGVPDHVSLWGVLLPIRFGFDQYVNLRPIQFLDGIEGPLRGRTAADIDILCIRENSEGEYTDIGGRFHVGLEDEVALQTAVFTRKGIERIARYTFERARERRKRLASATKSNALKYSAVLWDEVVAEVALDYPDVALAKYHHNHLCHAGQRELGGSG